MKSIIQEASSLSKAIEQGWIKAGKPKEFSVRILQDSDKNFLGITTKNAKIAVFFGRIDEQKYQQEQPQPGKQPQQTQQARPQRPRPQQRGSFHKRPAYKK